MAHTNSIFTTDLSVLEAELNAVVTADLILDRKEAELQALLPAGKKVWVMFGWPVYVGRLIGFAKTVVQNKIVSDDPAYKYANLTLKVSGSLPFYNKNGQKIEAREPQYQTLQKSLWYMASIFGIQNEILEDLKSITPALWQEMVEAAESRLDVENFARKCEEEMNGKLADADLPF